MDNTNVIIKPLITEKSTHLQNTRNTFVFEVNQDANKHQIKKAVEQLYSVKVEDVRTSTTAGKLRRRGRFTGYRGDWKKAYVRLKAGEKMPEYAEI